MGKWSTAKRTDSTRSHFCNVTIESRVHRLWNPRARAIIPGENRKTIRDLRQRTRRRNRSLWQIGQPFPATKDCVPITISKVSTYRFAIRSRI